jgi:hypothetical protein
LLKLIEKVLLLMNSGHDGEHPKPTTGGLTDISL